MIKKKSNKSTRRLWKQWARTYPSIYSNTRKMRESKDGTITRMMSKTDGNDSLVYIYNLA
jgi:hypothetical protein